MTSFKGNMYTVSLPPITQRSSPRVSRKMIEAVDVHKETLLPAHRRVATHELTVIVTECIYMIHQAQARPNPNT